MKRNNRIWSIRTVGGNMLKYSIKPHFVAPTPHGLFGVGATDDNPCDLFERIDFPVDEFFPPERGEFLECDQDDISKPEDDSDCGCRR